MKELRKIDKEKDIANGMERMCSMCQQVKSIAEFKVVRQKRQTRLL